MTVVITTAYLDEAERCNRVGLMYRGSLIRCDSPEQLRTQLEEPCYEVLAPDRRGVKALLETAPGVLSVEPAGSALHLFVVPGQTTAERLRAAVEERGLGPAIFTPMIPSLEDVFIALVRKAGGDGRAAR
jgi:ABC-2 type transport system ATP-binding protein